ncbi:MAG: hypothetical protein H0T84_13005 [Tatlockia sp.]|nr:hypothetical protein [Tatlockia sp.]
MKIDKNMLDDNITEILNDPERVTKIIQSGIQDALLKHKQAGNQVCEWRDNKVVWISPEKIIINK